MPDTKLISQDSENTPHPRLRSVIPGDDCVKANWWNGGKPTTPRGLLPMATSLPIHWWDLGENSKKVRRIFVINSSWGQMAEGLDKCCDYCDYIFFIIIIHISGWLAVGKPSPLIAVGLLPSRRSPNLIFVIFPNGSIFLHTKARKSLQNRFRNKTA